MTIEKVILVAGDDSLLIAETVSSCIDKAIGNQDRSLVLEELDENNYRTEKSSEFSAGPLVDAAQTPPFLTESRVVVGRHIGRFGTKEQIEPLLKYLNSPLPTTTLILVWEKGVEPAQQRLPSLPKSLAEAVEGAGGRIISSTVGRGKEADQWLEQRLNSSDIEIDRKAQAAIINQLGQDRTRAIALLALLETVFGPGAQLTINDVTPYLGEEGDVAPWDLTDAIDRGNTVKALESLRRLQGAGGRHPLAILSMLHSHYGQLLKLDGLEITSEKQVSDTLGVKGFPAKKILQRSQRFPSESIKRGISLVAAADLDLKGKTAWPAELVTEVLVARLCSLPKR